MGIICCEFLKPIVDLNILPMSRVRHNYSFQPIIPSYFNTQSQDMCHGTIGSDLINIEFQPDQNSSTL
jgi:hypothetical protein